MRQFNDINNKCSLRIYDNIGDFIENINKSETKNIYFDMYCTIQNISTQDMINNSYLGDKNLASKINKQVDIASKELSTGIVNRNKLQNSFYGSKVNVPKYTMGLPDSMYRFKKQEINQKILNVLIDIGYPWKVSNEDAERKMIEIFSYITSLEQKGYRIQLNVSHLVYTNNQVMFDKIGIIIPLKKPSERLNLMRFITICCNPKFFRTLMFAELREYWQNKVANLGYAMWLNENYYSKFLNELVAPKLYSKEDNLIALNYHSDLKQAFSKYL